MQGNMVNVPPLNKLDGELIAKNRNKRTAQKEDSLFDWYEKQHRKKVTVKPTICVHNWW